MIDALHMTVVSKPEFLVLFSQPEWALEKKRASCKKKFGRKKYNIIFFWKSLADMTGFKADECSNAIDKFSVFVYLLSSAL